MTHLGNTANVYFINIYEVKDTYMTIYVNTMNNPQVYNKVDTWAYPSGEIHLPPKAISDVQQAQHIKLRLLTSYDWMEWLYLCRQYKGISVSLGYIPNARDDKYEKGKRFPTVTVSNSLLLTTDCIYLVIDPHSNLSTGGGPVYKVLPPPKYPTNVDAAVVVPDKGAIDRATHYYTTHHSQAMPMAFCEKVRSREVVSTQLNFTPDPTAEYVIYDDICDGGATFLKIAEAMKKAGGYSKLTLCVTHGLFTNDALDRLLKGGFDEVHFTNSLLQDPSKPLDYVHSARLEN